MLHEMLEMIDKLTIQFNRSRQAAITNELIEIISGAEALELRRKTNEEKYGIITQVVGAVVDVCLMISC